MEKPLTVGSLFAGIGGFDLGFERSGYEIKWQVEIEPFCLRVLEKHFPNAQRFEDVRNVGKHNLPYVDVICGGFPCQDISFAGRGAGLDGERSGLFFEIPRILSELRPKYAVLENVPALLKRGMGRVLGALAEVGYDAEWKVISARDFGFEHKRSRVWIVSYPQREGLEGCQPKPRVFKSEATTLPQRSDNPFGGGGGLDAAITRLRRVDGLSVRMVGNGIKGFGNAVVPQIPEWIARQILKYEESYASNQQG